MNATPHINRSMCKKFLLDPEHQRFHKFNRVRASVFDELEFEVRKAMRHVLNRQPSKGKTIM